MPDQPDPSSLLTVPVDAQQLIAIAELQVSRRDKAKLRALAKVSLGISVQKAARAERIARKTLLGAIADYNRGGLYSVLPTRRGRPVAMSDQDILKTRNALLNELPIFKAWTPILLSLWLKEQFGHAYRYRPEDLVRVASIITDGQCVLPPHTTRGHSRRAKRQARHVMPAEEA